MKDPQPAVYLPDDVLVVIPARFSSSRLPGKPLAQINGVPMILRTVSQCLKVTAPDNLVVATDDARILELCLENGVRAEMTDSSHPTGGDRVAEVAMRLGAKKVINLQGDEPVFNPNDILKIYSASQRSPETVHIGYCSLEETQWSDPNFIKLIFGRDNRLIYIGRAQVPGSLSGGFHVGYRQVCVYYYPEEQLRRFASTDGRTPLEKIEDNEVMRFLELGIPVKVVELSSDSISVDRPKDLSRVEQRLAQDSKSGPNS